MISKHKNQKISYRKYHKALVGVVYYSKSRVLEDENKKPTKVIVFIELRHYTYRLLTICSELRLTPMYIYIMRHGEAVPDMLNDRQRPLTAVGIKEANAANNWLLEQTAVHETEVSHAFVSPYIRAQQTFAEVSTGLSLAETLTLDDIRPTGDCFTLHHFIDVFCTQRENVSALLLVSHMPFVSYLVDELCGQPLSIIFATGSILCIDYDLSQSKGRLVERFDP